MADGISISITEDVTSVTVAEEVTTIDITPSVTTVEAKGIALGSAGSATATAYQNSNTNLAVGSTVAEALDDINTNGFNKNLDQTIDGNITFADGHTITFPTSGYTALELNDNSMNVAGITASADITSATKMEAPLFKGDLEGAVHFKASGSGLAKGDVVYITGYQGNKTTVDKADASDSAKMPAFGIVNATQGGNVDILTFGSMLHLSTTGIATGTELYVSASTPGGYETSAPTGEGNLVQKIAKVVRGDSNSGSIKIMGAGRTNATPNLNSGNIFLGNASNISTTASFDTTFASSFATRTTTDLTEGDNEYFTSARADTRVDLQTGSNLDLSQKTTTELAEGDNEYFTSARADARVDLQTGSNLDLSQKTTTELTEGTNKYYTDARVNDKLSSGVDNIVTAGYLRGPSTFTIDPSGHGDNTGKVVIAGDLQVDGTTTTINSTQLTIDDKVIEVASNATNTSEANGAGISVGGTTANIAYTSSFDGWTFNKSIDLNGNLLLSGSFSDSNNSTGTAGQALLSTGTATEWGDISTTLNVEADSGDTQSIAMLTENLDIAGGTGISTATTDNTVTVKLDDTAVTAGTYGAAETVPQITVDAQGRITSLSNITGNTGPRGAHAATTFDYKFSRNDMASNNPSTYMSLSSYDYTASDLKLSVNYTDNNSNDLTDLIREVTTVNSYVTLINNANPEKFVVLKITDAARDISVGGGAYECLVVSVERVAGVLGSTSGTEYQNMVAGLAIGDGTDLPPQPYITAAFSKAGELAALPASTFSYTNNYDTVLGITQHVSGAIAFNNWDYEAATSMSISKTDSNSKDVEDLIEHLLGGNGLPIKALITITNQLNPSKYVTFEVDTISGFNSEQSDYLTVSIDYKSGITGKDSNGDTTDAAGLVPLYGVGPGPLAVSILRLPDRSTIDTTGIVYGMTYSNDLTASLSSGRIAVSSHTYTSDSFQMKLHSTSNESTSVKDFIRNSATSTSTPKGHLRLTSLEDQEYSLFQIDGIADSSSNDYTILDLTHVSGSTGGVAYQTTDLVVVSLQNAADIGDSGANGALTLEYDFNPSLAYSSPSSGYLQFNKWDYTLSGMRVGISNIDRLGNDLTSTIRYLTGSTNPDAKGYLTVVNKNDKSRYVILRITDSYYSNSQSGYTLFSVERIAGSEGGATSGSGVISSELGASSDVLVSIQRAADFGDIDTALDTSSANSNEVLSWTGSAYDWVPQSAGVEDDISVSTVSLDTGDSDWKVSVNDDNELEIHYGSTKVFELSSSGHLKVSGNITAYTTFS